MNPSSDAGTAGSTTSELTTEHKRLLLHVARRALTEHLSEGTLFTYATDAPALLASRASFVTLTRRSTGELRGCRGESAARRPLIESVPLMAIAAATDDPRFHPITSSEMHDLVIEISALSPLVPIEPAHVVVGRHGLFIVQGPYSGLLLPQVPVEYGWDRTEFLGWLCRKAGLPLDAWTASDAQLFGFEAEVWNEEGC